MYSAWAPQVPEDLEILGVQLPGREERLTELPFDRWQPLVAAVVARLRPYLDLPYVLFGHSLGALVAFEAARELRRQHVPGPLQLIISGKVAPTIGGAGPPMHLLPEAEFRRRLGELQGTPAEVLDHAELMRVLLPMLRADFAVSETYSYPGGEILECPLVAYRGVDDPLVSRAALECWRSQTTGAFVVREFAGGHFYLRSSEAFFSALAEDLASARSRLWRVAPADLSLAEGEVHLWRAHLDMPAETLARVAEVLSPDEQKRRAAFYFQRDRDRFAASHGMLRYILGRYLGMPPERVIFRFGKGGKPEVDGATPITFNLSHSHELALVGVTRGRQVGVDVELQRSMPDAFELAKRYFSSGEKEVLRQVPEDQRERAFFRCWTRKEAYLKARGLGLALPLDRFEVAFAPGAPARLLQVVGEPDELSRWWMTDLPMGPDGHGACVVERGPCRLILSDWRMPE